MATTKGKSDRYLSPVFRLSFPNLFEAHAMDAQSKAKFGCTAVWTPANFSARDKELWGKIGKALNEASQAAFKKNWKDLGEGYKKGLRSGADKDLEGFGAGTMFANLTTKMRPGVIDLQNNKIGPEEGNAEEIYPGCYCRATVTVYSYNNKGKGVALGLMNIQKVKDGERLDGRSKADEDFKEGVDDSWLEGDEDNLGGRESVDEDIPF